MRVGTTAQLFTPGRNAGALLTVAAASLFAVQAPSSGAAQTALPAELASAVSSLPAEPYFGDLALALGATSADVADRAAALGASRAARARAAAGLSFAGEASPIIEFERDLADPTDQGAWGTDIDLSVGVSYRRDAQALARAGLAVTVAEARLNDQARDDLQRSLLALSTMRLAQRDLEDAAQAAAQAAAAVAEAEARGAAAVDLMPLRIAVELASNAVEREQAAVATAADAAARLGLTTAVPPASTLLEDGRTLGALAPSSLTRTLMTVPTPEQHGRARTLSSELAVAVARANGTPFDVVREIEVYGAYENAGFEIQTRAALATGVPVIGSTLSWTNGSDDVGFVVGVGATLKVTDATAATAAAASQAVSEARALYAAFLDAQVSSELAARRAAEREFEDFALTSLQLMSAQALVSEARAAGASERELQRLATAHRRAQDATERAWQRYVRSLVSYLGVADATWRSVVMEER